MKKLLLAVVMMASLPCLADGPPPSEASIRELIAVSDSKKLLDGIYVQMDSMMEQAMKQALAGKTVTAEQEKLMAEFRTKTVDIMRDEMSWEKLEPDYLELYSKTFSQSEIDGMLAFYKSDAGKAVIAKMPQMMQHLMQLMMVRMQSLMPRIQKLQDEYIPKLKNAG